MELRKHFYHHLVDLSDLEKQLMQDFVDECERQELLDTIHKTIHLEVIHYILNELPENERVSFLTQVEDKPQDQGIGVYLQRSVRDLDDKLLNVINLVKQDFKDAINDYLESTRDWYLGN